MIAMDVKDGWIEFCKRYDFRQFITLTFKRNYVPVKNGSQVVARLKLDDQTAFRLFRQLVKRIDQSLEHKFGKLTKLKYLVVAEGQSSDQIHLHSLLVGESSTLISPRQVNKIWFKLSGNSTETKVEPITDLNGITNYIFKGMEEKREGTSRIDMLL